MSKKYRILVESSPVVGEVHKHAFVVLQYARPDGTFADVHKDEDAIIYRSGPANSLFGPDFSENTDRNNMERIIELNASYVSDDHYGPLNPGNVVTHIGSYYQSPDYNKYHDTDKYGEHPKNTDPLREVYEGDGSIDAETILNELSLRFAHANLNYNTIDGFDETHANSNTYVGWLLQETLKEIQKQGGEAVDIETIEKEWFDDTYTEEQLEYYPDITLNTLLPGISNRETVDIDMSSSIQEIKDELTLTTIIRNYLLEEKKVLYDLKLKLDEIDTDPWGAAGFYDSYKQMLQSKIEKLEINIDLKIQNMWDDVAPLISEPSKEHGFDLTSQYEVQGGTNSNNFFDIHVNFSHGTAGSEQKSESETIQSVINDGLIYHWGGTTISSSTVNEAGFWAEINAAISDGFQPGRGNVINSTASDQIKNYYWQAEGLEDSVYLNSFGYISNFSQHLEDYNDKNAIIYRSDSAKPLSCL